MQVKQPTKVYLAESYFEPGIPIFVNRANESFDLIEHSHEFIEITYVSEGAGVHYIAGESVSVQQGTLFFIPVGRSHVFRPKTPKKDHPLVVYNCLFPTEYLTDMQITFPYAASILATFTDSQIPWLEMKDPTGDYGALFRELYREYASRPPGYLAILSSLIVRILTGLYRHQLQDGPLHIDKPQWLNIDEAIAYINRNLSSELRLNELAAQACLSERQFSRLFQRQTGMSFIEYVQNIRMESACHMLISEPLRVKDIAIAVGYADLKFFHRLFKRKTGTTPQQYRKAHRSIHSPSS